MHFIVGWSVLGFFPSLFNCTCVIGLDFIVYDVIKPGSGAWPRSCSIVLIFFNKL